MVSLPRLAFAVTAGAMLALGCGAPEKPDAAPRSGCVERYDPAADYFPTKLQPRFARRFQVEYHRHYATVTVQPPWQVDAESDRGELRYLFWRCGTPRPELDPDDASQRALEIPPRRVATTSTTELPHLVALGVGETWVGHTELDFVGADALRARIDTGQVRELGSPVQLETLVALGPDLLFADFLGRAELDRLALYAKSGQAVVMVPSFREETPLGRAEWLLFFGLIFDRPEAAQRQFEAIVRDYQRLVDQVREAGSSRPTVLLGGPFQDIWHVAAGRSFGAQLLADAGAAYLWADADQVAALPLNLEAVMRRAHHADFWLYPSGWTSMAEIAAADSRLTEIEAYRQGRVWANDLRRRPGGANDFWELGVTRPDLVLADLVAIFHPNLLPGHVMAFHRPLGPPPDPGR